ncbi:dephospho-CoA kinase/protein folding accessory domain-containing protein [Planctomycetes bacterium CA13]|uniref:Dephospho-CoA kinase/protein folding accessory domain-containing protein n=1 Tax=Novipirellula herctigrandis TaxID=2527986 RepID=A0A5C5Z225_9BACT|nr:dephospho-CoA kinase/protein folding accessory domain-containing protein [Planctomycetes bacterium CA13]
MENASVRLMHYDPRWRQEFEQTRSSILSSCEGDVVAVEHIGSTAISGLIARPTIDVLAGVTNPASIPSAARLIEGLNFRREPFGDWHDRDGVQLIKPRHRSESEPEPTHCVFLMVHRSDSWKQTIAIRDFLRTHPELAIDFEEAKVKQWRHGEGDPRRYAANKAIFFAHLLDQM